MSERERTSVLAGKSCAAFPPKQERGRRAERSEDEEESDEEDKEENAEKRRD